MIRLILLIAGCLLLLFKQHIFTISTNSQTIIFLVSILLLGVPHGSADLLVANRTASDNNKPFSRFKFLYTYLGRLAAFAAVLWFFPVPGNLMFLLLAAAHFGETDLHVFKTNSVLGKLFATSYGLMILCVIIIFHFEEVKPIYLQFESGQQQMALLNWIGDHRYIIMSFSGLFFFACAFIYFLKNEETRQVKMDFLFIEVAVMLVILFSLPMLIGFTFYFVVWHSVLSLRNILLYLRKGDAVSRRVITKEIVLYSALAVFGILLFGVTGFMFANNNAIMGYLFLGLAVLTAPHMQIMHDMYKNIRLQTKF